VGYVDSPWLITSVGEAQFWPVDFAATYGDGRAHESMSAIVSKWTAPGVIYGKAAQDCTPDEIAREVWEQMKRHLNDTGQAVLTDDLLLSWEIDPGMLRRGDRVISDDPLVLPSTARLNGSRLKASTNSGTTAGSPTSSTSTCRWAGSRRS
jgi:hypothetical protein